MIPRLALGPVAAVAAALAALLLAVSGRYGYHRDELYFLAAGRHLAWGYPDQPPFAPLVARAMSALAPHSLVVLRLPAVLAAAALVVVAAATARELGEGRPGQLLTAVTTAVSGVVLAGAHLMGTTVFDLLAWAVIVLLVLRALRTGEPRWWVVIGVVAGIGLLDNTLVAFLMLGIGVGMVLVGPRRQLRSPWLWVGAVLAVALWLPYLLWQARHGWPQLDESRAIARGQSGTSQPRWLFVPFQVLLVSPVLVPLWVAGLVRLLRDPALRWARCIGVAYVVLTVVFLLSGGKPYYIAGLYPALLAGGAGPALRRVTRRGARRAWAAVIAVGFVISVLVTLPVLPQRAFARSGLVALNYDAGEQVAWPSYVRQVADAQQRVHAPILLASNYGEAGAIDRYGGRHALPRVYSGHTGYWYWGPPPDGATSALAIGFSRGYLLRFFRDVRPAGRLDNGIGLDSDEQHAPLWACEGLRRPWHVLWPQLRHA